MLIIKTYIAKSEIEGIGVFAAERLSEGQTISRFDPTFDRLVSIEAYRNAPPYLKALLDRYAFPHPRDPRFIVYEVDNCRFLNHSENPNTDFTDFAAATAIRDIDIGEELTCHYGGFFEDFELLPHETELNKA